MKQSILMVTLLTASFLLAPNAFAATSEVTWTDYKSYRDIDEGNDGRKQFRERIFKDFEEHFAKLAATLPAEQTLKIDVTDVDLAVIHTTLVWTVPVSLKKYIHREWIFHIKF